jgi:hypothetical protein
MRRVLLGTMIGDWCGNHRANEQTGMQAKPANQDGHRPCQNQGPKPTLHQEVGARSGEGDSMLVAGAMMDVEWVGEGSGRRLDW